MFSLNLRKSCQIFLFENKNVANKLAVGLTGQHVNHYSKPKVRSDDRRMMMRRRQLTVENMDKNFLKREVVDPVWLFAEYKPQVLQIEEAIKNHIEMAQTDILNNPSGFLSVRLFLDMTTKKKAKFMEDFSGAVYYPNTFKEGIQKEVIAICKSEKEIAAAKEAGALHAGHEDVIQMFVKGEIVDQMYDFLVCTPETFPDVLLIKKKIHKDKLPSLKTNTISQDIGDCVRKWYLSKDYETVKITDQKASLKVKIGTLDMGVEKLTENLTSLIHKVRDHKKHLTDDFITECVVFAAPSTEKFKVDLSRFSSAKPITEASE